jgi:hypothetical protein
VGLGHAQCSAPPRVYSLGGPAVEQSFGQHLQNPPLGPQILAAALLPRGWLKQPLCTTAIPVETGACVRACEQWRRGPLPLPSRCAFCASARFQSNSAQLVQQGKLQRGCVVPGPCSMLLVCPPQRTAPSSEIAARSLGGLRRCARVSALARGKVLGSSRRGPSCFGGFGDATQRQGSSRRVSLRPNGSSPPAPHSYAPFLKPPPSPF